MGHFCDIIKRHMTAATRPAVTNHVYDFVNFICLWVDTMSRYVKMGQREKFASSPHFSQTTSREIGAKWR